MVLGRNISTLGVLVYSEKTYIKSFCVLEPLHLVLSVTWWYFTLFVPLMVLLATQGTACFILFYSLVNCAVNIEVWNFYNLQGGKHNNMLPLK